MEEDVAAPAEGAGMAATTDSPSSLSRSREEGSPEGVWVSLDVAAATTVELDWLVIREVGLVNEVMSELARASWAKMTEKTDNTGLKMNRINEETEGITLGTVCEANLCWTNEMMGRPCAHEMNLLTKCWERRKTLKLS
ncbi:MAG: hypothetical protein ACTS46_00990 [Candidatus Hodgkinia cicadicola]